jgi:hypothetical protein
VGEATKAKVDAVIPMTMTDGKTQTPWYPAWTREELDAYCHDTFGV